MDVRGKLVELLNKANSACVGTDCFEGCKFYMENDCLYKLMADVMIENGVTVQECAEWEEIEDDWNMETIYKCSACKEEFVTIDGTPADYLWNYCPHCGAKMMHQPPKGE